MDKGNENIYSYEDVALIESLQTCTFCSQFKFRHSRNIPDVIFGDNFNRILFEDDNFVIVPALGQIIEGYLLIISKDHYNSIAQFPESLRQQFIRLKGRVLKVLSKEYSTPIFFEHGSSSPYKLGGGCINHAHIHAVPVNINFIRTEINDLNPVYINGIHDLWTRKIDHPYIYFETVEHDAYFIDCKTELPCQYLRRIIARETGVPHLWNWRTYIGTQEIKNTLKKLSDKFN